MDHYPKSNFAKRITVFFDEYTGYPVSPEAFSCARDHLVVILLLSTGQRSGVVRNMTYEEYLKTRKRHMILTLYSCVSWTLDVHGVWLCKLGTLDVNDVWLCKLDT